MRYSREDLLARLSPAPQQRRGGPHVFTREQKCKFCGVGTFDTPTASQPCLKR